MRTDPYANYVRVILLFHGCLCGGETCDRHAERRARCVVHANLGAELHRAGLTTVLTADTATEIGTNLATFLDGKLDETAHTLLVENLERVYLQDLLVEIDGQERSDVRSFVPNEKY